MPLDLRCDIRSLCVHENRWLAMEEKVLINEGKHFWRVCSHCAAKGYGRSTLLANSVFNLVVALSSWLTIFTQSTFPSECLPDSLPTRKLHQTQVSVNESDLSPTLCLGHLFQASLRFFTFGTLHGHYKRSQWVAEWRLQSASALSDKVLWDTEIIVVRKIYLGQKYKWFLESWIWRMNFQ